MSNLTLELDTNTMQKLTALAEASHQSVSQWIEQVVVSFEAMQDAKALIADVQLAQQQLSQGQGIEHDGVKANLLAAFAV